MAQYPYIYPSKTSSQVRREAYQRLVDEERHDDEPKKPTLGSLVMKTFVDFPVAGEEAVAAAARRVARGGMAEQAIDWQVELAKVMPISYMGSRALDSVKAFGASNDLWGDDLLRNEKKPVLDLGQYGTSLGEDGFSFETIDLGRLEQNSFPEKNYLIREQGIEKRES